MARRGSARWTTAWRRGGDRDEGPEANLDDLFQHEFQYEEAASAPAADEARPQPWLAGAAFQAFAASAVIYTLLHVFDLAAPYPLILAVCAGAVLVRRSIRLTTEPSWLRTGDVVRPPYGMRRVDPAGWREGGDSMVDAVRRWDRRLDLGVEAPERFRATVLPRLGELSDERLRQRHGITRSSDPARARGLLGAQLWNLLHDEGHRVPSRREVAAAVERLEQL